jgi:hypothetical protein
MRSRVALAVVLLTGCFRWSPVALDDVRGGRAEIRTRTVRVSAAEERATMVVHRVTPTHLDGWDVGRRVERRVPLDRVRDLRVRETDPVGSALAVGAVYLTIGLLGWLAVVIDPF